MTFKDWIYSRYANPAEQNQWGILHISVLVICIATIVALAFTVRKSKKASNITIITLASIILFLEVLRRVLNFTRHLVYGGEFATNFRNIAYYLLPRPWCAISCWIVISTLIFKKKFLYNLASMNALICALIFFAYPSVGFNNKYMLFENVYSITTHSLLLITSISMITLNHADFRYSRGKKWTETALVELIGIALVFAYATLEILLNIEADPLYFMANNDVMKILGFSHAVYLIAYTLFLALYFNLFYLAPIAFNKIMMWTCTKSLLKKSFKSGQAGIFRKCQNLRLVH